jgi:transposase
LKRENYLYIGVDLHKESHTAVLVNCWNEKLKTITIKNKPSEFTKLTQAAGKAAFANGLSPVYGLENANGYGRALAVWLNEKGCIVKDVNPALAYEKRKSAPAMKKNDEYDAYSVATVMINQFHDLPDARTKDNHWTLSQLVNRRERLSEDGIRIKNALHQSVSAVYPSYKEYFCNIDTKTALYFWLNYPSPMHLEGVTAENLYKEFKTITANVHMDKAELIIECIRADGKTHREYQESRDFITRSLVKDLNHQSAALEQTEKEIEKILATFDHKLTTLPGVGTAIASKLITEIGDICRFKSADKLAAFAGISPKTFSSGGKGHDESNKQGNRALHSMFYFLAVSMVCVHKNGRPYHPVFYEYFLRKISEGKTKSQALVCIMRRLVNIVYGMMKNKTAYRPFNSADKNHQ